MEWNGMESRTVMEWNGIIPPIGCIIYEWNRERQRSGLESRAVLQRDFGDFHTSIKCRTIKRNGVITINS